MIDAQSRRLAVYGLAVDAERVLLARIARGFPGAGRWTLPGGGLEWGESPIEGLRREVFEETGTEVTVAEPIELFSVVVTAPDGAAIHSFQLVYRVELIGELRVEESGSTDAVAWHRLDFLPSMVSLVPRSLDAWSVQSSR